MASLAELIPQLAGPAQYLVSYVAQYRPIRVTSVYRSYTEQLELYRNRARNPYPVAPPGQSMHGYRRAFDVSATPDVLAWMGQVWKGWGGRWGGDLADRPDPIHFEG